MLASVVSIGFGVVSVCLCIAWINGNFYGFLTSGSIPDPISTHGFFNWHIVLGLSGICLGFLPAALTYQMTQSMRRLNVNVKKNIHAVLSGLALLSILGAVTIVIIEHRHVHGYNFSSVHSWIGISFAILFTFQWIIGFTALHFWKHKVSSASVWGRVSRSVTGSSEPPLCILKSLHRFMGLMFFGMSAAIIASGVVEKQDTVMSSNDPNLGDTGHKLAVVKLGNFVALFAFVALTVAGLRIYQFDVSNASPKA
eukprot:TRINITY_DN157_c0_g1_i2.p1 TRINITY_DN157_c0_g1~~TRINITY_DN157_c0_g1_i2.p1  ORF type:complete len:254 (-),score=48.77 TRINITY_DN157_c0_g1_i2:76-837(-)